MRTVRRSIRARCRHGGPVRWGATRATARQGGLVLWSSGHSCTYCTSRDRDPRDFLPWWIAHAGVLVRQVVVAPNPRIDPRRDMARPWAEILLAWSQELGGDALRIPTLDEIAVVVARDSERGLGA